MKTSNVAVFGIYRSRAGAERVIDELRTAGFGATDISILYSHIEGDRDLAIENSTKAPEGATTGAVTGASVGTVLGFLAGVGTLAIPGVGPLIAAGPIMAAIAGLGVGGTLGGLTGALVGLGIPEYEARRYDSRIHDGGFLVSVHAPTKEAVRTAKEILKNTGAEDISSQDEIDRTSDSDRDIEHRPHS